MIYITTAKDAGVPSQFLRGRLRQKTWLKKLGLYVNVEEDVKFGVIVEQVIVVLIVQCSSKIEGDHRYIQEFLLKVLGDYSPLTKKCADARLDKISEGKEKKEIKVNDKKNDSCRPYHSKFKYNNS